MKILQICSAKHFGGGEKHLLDLCKGLQKRGNEVFLLLRPTITWKNKLDFLPQENIFYHPIRNSLDIFCVSRIAKIVRENQFEIIHSHVARDYSIAALASFLSKKPLILTRHLTFKLNYLHRLTFKQVSKLIAVSEGVAESLLSHRFISAPKIECIRNGVDTNYFGKCRENLELNDFEKTVRGEINLLVATIGELREHKGQEDFIRAAFLVAQKFPEAKFLLVGQDNSQDKKYQVFLEKLVVDLGLEKQIIFTGWQDNLSDVYSAIDLFVSAARSEPFGLVIAEAMASGKAVIATNTVGGKELIANNETGKIVPIGNVEAIAEAIIELLKDKEIRLALGKKAQIVAGEKFSLERMISETEQVYRDVLRECWEKQGVNALNAETKRTIF